MSETPPSELQTIKRSAIILTRQIIDDIPSKDTQSLFLFPGNQLESFFDGVLEIAETRDEDFELTPEAIAFGMAAMCFATAKLNDIEKARFWQARFDAVFPPENSSRHFTDTFGSHEIIVDTGQDESADDDEQLGGRWDEIMQRALDTASKAQQQHEQSEAALRKLIEFSQETGMYEVTENPLIKDDAADATKLAFAEVLAKANRKIGC